MEADKRVEKEAAWIGKRRTRRNLEKPGVKKSDTHGHQVKKNYEKREKDRKEMTEIMQL